LLNQLDARAIDVLQVKALIDNGYLTYDDLAKYLNSFGDNAFLAGYLFNALYLNYGADFVANILNSANLGASRIADMIGIV